MFWFEAMKWGIIMASIFASYNLTLCLIRNIKLHFPGLWVSIGTIIMMLYWMAYYVRSVLDLPIFTNHQVYVRAPLMLTIMLIGAASAYGSRRRV